MIPPVLMYVSKPTGYEPKENTIVQTFREEIDDAVNKVLYGRYKTADGSEFQNLSGQDRYARAGLVQYAVEQRYRVRCRLVARAIADIDAAVKDESFKKTLYGGDYVFVRVAKETRARLEKLITGHGKHCPKECCIQA